MSNTIFLVIYHFLRRCCCRCRCNRDLSKIKHFKNFLFKKIHSDSQEEVNT